MESFSQSQIARLVLGNKYVTILGGNELFYIEFIIFFTDFKMIINTLIFAGYLKAEKCSTAYEAFLDTSSHLKEYRENFMTTRVLGLTLIDYLTEYALLYNISKKKRPKQY